jgi:hypothetical protein
MDNTAEKETGPARTFAEMIRLNRKTLFLHTATGRFLTLAAGVAAVVTSVATSNVGLAAACGALLVPALAGRIVGRHAGTISPRSYAAILALTFAYPATIGVLKDQFNNRRTHFQSLTEMKPDTIVTTTAKEHYCAPEQKKGWIEVKGLKLNCGN